MKNSEIHTGFPDKDVRDFLAISEHIASTGLNNNKREAVRKGDDALQDAINHCEREIEWLQRQMQYYKRLQSVDVLVKNQGWQSYDVSDLIYADIPGGYMPFVGTKEEFEEFKIKISTEE